MTNMEAALKALKVGIIVKRYESGYNAFDGSELYIVFYKGEYNLGVMSRSGYLAVNDYGKVWGLKPEDYCDTKNSDDILFQELYEENFGA